MSNERRQPSTGTTPRFLLSVSIYFYSFYICSHFNFNVNLCLNVKSLCRISISRIIWKDKFRNSLAFDTFLLLPSFATFYYKSFHGSSAKFLECNGGNNRMSYLLSKEELSTKSERIVKHFDWGRSRKVFSITNRLKMKQWLMLGPVYVWKQLV